MITLDHGLPVSFAFGTKLLGPFKFTTTIAFSLLQGGMTDISIYDISGRKVEKLISVKIYLEDILFKYDASDLLSGMYFYSIVVADEWRVVFFINQNDTNEIID